MSEKTVNKKKKPKKRTIILSIIFILVFAMVGISASYYSYVKSKIYTESNEIKIKTVDKKSEDEVNYKEVEGITNVLLVGTDGRDVNEKARADSIIIATLDKNKINIIV